MKGILSKSKIEYVFFHLEHFVELSDSVKEKIQFNKDRLSGNGNIFFNLTDADFDISNITLRNGIPVLFPNVSSDSAYTFSDGDLNFHDDILKSAFYLLSGYQEYQSPHKDFLGRFPYDKSIQRKLGIIQKPIVNYYFEIIIEGIQAFCKFHNIAFQRKVIFPDAGLMLTHDIDIIDTYNFPDFVFKIKQLLGITRAKYPYVRILKSNLKYIANYLNPLSRKNPFWNFNFLMDLDREMGFKSSFYFLHKDQIGDSYYTFNDKRIQKLIPELIENGHEVGLHGTIRTSTDLKGMKENLRLLQDVTPEKIWGGRQHRLMFQMPLTLKIHEKCGLIYDSTLGFAGHEGFRNSYCLPFKLYDFDNDRMIDVWEIPLTVMDGTLFSYRKLNNNVALESVMNLYKEIEKFNGVFTLLWHNSFFDDDLYPGLTDFYKKILTYLKKQKVKSYKGAEIAKIMNQHA